MSRDATGPARCRWPVSPLDIAYHDTEWGVPVHDDRVLFEFLVLEGAQAGLSWSTVLGKRPHYRAALAQFDPARVARFTPARIDRLMDNAGLIRHRGKLESAVANARAFLQVQREFGSFDAYLWPFVDNRPVVRRRGQAVATRTDRSDALSADLKRRGFSFVGSTICHAYMQAVGLVNDHELHCFRRAEILALAR